MKRILSELWRQKPNILLVAGGVFVGLTGAFGILTAFGEHRNPVGGVDAGTPEALIPTSSTFDQVSTGLTFDQITGNGLGDYFAVKQESDVNARSRYVGKKFSPLTIFEIQGDQSEIFNATLILPMPEKSEERAAKNTGLAITFLGNADATWTGPQRNAWFDDALWRIIHGEREISCIRGKILIKATDMRPEGISVRVEASGRGSSSPDTDVKSSVSSSERPPARELTSWEIPKAPEPARPYYRITSILENHYYSAWDYEILPSNAVKFKDISSKKVVIVSEPYTITERTSRGGGF